jgi:sugar phosphate isomerase/epimerase
MRPAFLLLLALAASLPAVDDIFVPANRIAWCIVPFDKAKRTPEQRAAMLEQLGIKGLAYDWRAEHIPTFDAEIAACKAHGIAITAWWFPGGLDDTAKLILATLKKHAVKTDLWVTGGGSPTKSPEEQAKRVTAEAARIKPIAEAAAAIGCRVALYNHGAWFGEPDNQIAIIELLKTQGVGNVGIVYNQHHGHAHVVQFADLLNRMKPYLYALNLNGMFVDGDKIGKKITPIGQGPLDLDLLRIIRASGWQGPIGLLNHTDEDAEQRLRDNQEGLDWLVAQIDGKPALGKPVPRSWRP